MTGEAQFATDLGVRLRDIRSAADLRQDDVAQRARSVGLAWARSSVAALESGSRSLSAFEWLLLPQVYDCPADDLLRGVEVSPAPITVGPDETDRKVAARLGVEPGVVAARAVSLWGRGVAAERDARVSSGNNRSTQAARGHVTRTLVAEIAVTLEPEGGQRDGTN